MIGKSCPDCGQFKALSEFASNKRRTDGRSFYCRECGAARSKASYEKRRAAEGKVVKARTPQPPDPSLRRCADCQSIKPIEDFPRSGLRWGSYCKPCHNERGRATVEKLGGARHYHLRRRYGMGAAEVAALIEAQGGLCLICEERPAEHVDHDHATGAVRGILCFNCNGGLGQFRDRVDIMRNAIEYLEGFSG